MKGGKIIAAGSAILGVSLFAAYLTTRQPPQCAGYNISITGPSTIGVGMPETYDVTVMLNGKPVPDVTVNLIGLGTSGDTGSTTARTDAKGIAAFTVTVTVAGSYSLTGTITEKGATCKSPSLSVTAVTPCPSGQVHVNGKCEKAVLTLTTPDTDITSATLPVTVTWVATLTTSTGTPIPDVLVNFSEKGIGLLASEPTGVNGKVSFTVTISRYGEYGYYAEA